MAGQVVVDGAPLQCTMGAMPGSVIVTPPVPPSTEPQITSLPGPGALKVLPINRVTAGGGKPVANIADSKPMVNIAGFGLCMSLQNPDVAKATAAASGVLTPQPCQPKVPAPWMPGTPTVMVGGQPVLTATCTCQCVWGGGLITILNAGQVAVQA